MNFATMYINMYLSPINKQVLIEVRSEVGFPRDGTKIFPCPVVPLSLGKGRSKNPETNSSVPGRPRKNHILQKNQKTGKGCSKTGKGCSKTGKGHSKTGKGVLKQERTF
jgi:hypothetical protein